MFPLTRLALLRVSGFSQNAFAFAPLAAGLSSRDNSLDPTMFISGMAVLSAGLVVLRAAQVPAPRPRTVATASTVVNAEQVIERRKYTAEEVLAQREVRMGDREVLLNALATAAETFYSIAGHLPRDASDKALHKADDLRELVWLNRAR
ncbi:MAG: hypothetical protein AB7J35_13885 [Dehalococcoidia bacterium]